MDFQIYEKIFREEDVLKRYKILKNIAYIKIKENNNLKNYLLSLFHEIFQIISSNSSENFRNNKFILIIMLITQSLKENIKLVDLVQKEANEMIQEIFKFFWIHFSDECSQNYFGKN